MKGYLLRESTMIAIVIASINLILVISQVIMSYPFLTFGVAMQPLVHSISSAFLMHGMHYFCSDYYSIFTRTLQKVRRQLKFILVALLCWALYKSYIIRIGGVGHLTWRGIQEIFNQRKRLKISSRTVGIDLNLADSAEKTMNLRKIWLTTTIENIQRSIQKLIPKVAWTAFLNAVNFCTVAMWSIANLEIRSLLKGFYHINDFNSTTVSNSEAVKTLRAPTGDIQHVNSSESREKDNMSPSRRQRPPTLVRFNFSDSNDKPPADYINGLEGGRKTTSSVSEKTVLYNEISHPVAAAQKSVSFVDDLHASVSASGMGNGTRILDPQSGISRELLVRQDQSAIPTNQTIKRTVNTLKSDSKNQKAHVAFIEELETEFDHDSSETYPVTPSHNGMRGSSSSGRRGTHEVETLEDVDEIANLSNSYASQDASINSSGFFSAKKRQYPFTPQHDETTGQRTDTVDEFEYQEKKRLGNEFRSVLLGARALIVNHGPARNGNGQSSRHSSKRERGDDDYDYDNEEEDDKNLRVQRTDESLPYAERRIGSLPTRSDETRTEQITGRPVLKRTRKVTDCEEDRDRGNLDEELRIYQKSQFQIKTNRRKSEVLRGVSMLLGGEM
jgi:hypothetical protein